MSPPLPESQPEVYLYFPLFEPRVGKDAAGRGAEGRRGSAALLPNPEISIPRLMFPGSGPSQLMPVKSEFPFDVCSTGIPVSVQVFGAPPQQPRGPHGPGGEPDQHRHEERRL